MVTDSSHAKKHLMKYFLTLGCLWILGFFACKKSDDAAAVAPSVEGRWAWAETRSDGTPGPLNPLTPLNAGYYRILTFKGADWTQSRNDTVTSQGSFTLAVVKNIYDKPVNQIHYYPSNAPDYITYYTISNDSLGFSYDLSGTVGSGSELFVKTAAQ